MKPVRIPSLDVNSERATVVRWYAGGGAAVRAGEPLVEVETSKAIYDVEAPDAGFVLPLFGVGDAVPMDQPVALLFATEAELAAHRDAPPPAPGPPEGPRATVKARRRAEELGVDLAQLRVPGLITVKAVEAAARTATPPADLPEPLAGPAGAQRVALIGGGRGATQVIDIFRSGAGQAAVAIFDDSPDKWGQRVYGVPVVGGTDRLSALFEAGAFDAAVICISTSIAARTRLRGVCRAAGVPLANAVDPTSKIASETQIGAGNVICAFCQIGTSTVVGDNNFLSAYNSFDHHNVLGDDISTGPGVVTSSRVRIGHRVRLGTGIFMQPGVELGDDVEVASGAVITQSVPAGHAVKTRVVTTAVVPKKRG